MSNDLSHLPTPQVAVYCKRETERFWDNLPYDPCYCYELFRRALVDPHLESSKVEWGFIYRQYERQTQLWIKQHQMFPATGMDTPTLADLSLEKMWLSFHATPDKFSNFPADPESALPKLMKFLKLCIHSVVTDAARKRQKEDKKRIDDPDDQLAQLSAPSQTAEHDPICVWNCLYARLKDDTEKLVMDALYVDGLQPRHVKTLYPDLFDKPKDVSRVKERVLRRLTNDQLFANCIDTCESYAE